MKLFKLVWHDLKCGSGNKLYRCFIFMLMIVLIYLAFCVDVLSLYSNNDFEKISTRLHAIDVSLGDVLLAQFGGALQAKKSISETFSIPVKWFLPYACILYCTLGYVNDDLSHYGVQVITRCSNKNDWWLSKCIWNTIVTCGLFLMAGILLVFLSWVCGIDIGFTLNRVLFSEMLAVDIPIQTATNWEYLIVFCLVPMIVCATISLMQMTLSLFVKPVLSYIVVCSFFAAGIYYENPLFISNFLMPLRSDYIGISNLEPMTGMLLCVVYLVIIIVIGFIRVNKMDLIMREFI